jgi:hypothetical protein
MCTAFLACSEEYQLPRHESIGLVDLLRNHMCALHTHSIDMRCDEAHGPGIEDPLNEPVAALMRHSHERSDSEGQCLHAQVTSFPNADSGMFQVYEKRVIASRLGQVHELGHRKRFYT